jgi:tRNA threonylcarbamoyladenosine biosynthesis protein TsaB
MKLLAVDTSTPNCSVALVDNTTLIAEVTTGPRQTHSRHLMGMIRDLLGEAALPVNALEGFAVVKGPGSFTGLRIGISSIKGLAALTGKPVAGVSSLDALAWQCLGYNGLVCAMIDARKSEVYFAVYRSETGHLQRLTDEQVASPDTAVAAIAGPCLFVGSGALLYEKVIRKQLDASARLVPPSQHHIRGSTVAQLALERFERNDADPIQALVPAYVRQSDAEINWQKTDP